MPRSVNANNGDRESILTDTTDDELRTLGAKAFIQVFIRATELKAKNGKVSSGKRSKRHPHHQGKG